MSLDVMLMTVGFSAKAMGPRRGRKGRIGSPFIVTISTREFASGSSKRLK
jgi:hypothetical protein